MIAVRTVRWLAAALGIGVGVLLSLLASVWFHSSLPLAREVVRVEVNERVSALIEGRLEIGELTRVSPRRIVARRVAFYDPDGERVLYGEQVVLVPDVSAALAGWLHFKSARLVAGEVHLLDRNDDNVPSFVEGFQPVEEPSSEGEPFRAVVDGMTLEDVEVHGRLLDLEGIRVVGAQASGRLEVYGEVTIDIHSATGILVEPFPFEGVAEAVSGRFSTVSSEGLELRATGRIDRADGPSDRLDAALTVRTPEGEEVDHIRLDVRADPADARVLSEIGFEWAELFFGPARGTFRLEGPPDELRLEVDASTEGGPLVLSGRIPAVGDVQIKGATEGLELVSVVHGAPDLRFEGTGMLTVDGDDPEAPPEFQVLGKPFGLGELIFPTFEIDGTVHSDHVAVERLTTPYAGGNLDLDGRIAFDGTSTARVRGSIPEISRDPNVRRIAPGLRGGVHLDVRFEASPEGQRTSVSGRTVFRRFRYGPFRADRLRVDGRVSGDFDRPTLDVRVQVTGLYAYDVLLGDGTGSARGPAGRYATRLDVAAAGRSLAFSAGVTLPRPGHVEVQSQDVTIGLEDETWRGTVADLVFAPDEVRAGNVVLRHGEESVRIEGSIGKRTDEALEIGFTGFEVDHLRPFIAGFPAMAGLFDGRAGLEGSLDDPVFDIEGTLRDGTFGELSQIEVFFTAGVGEGQFDLTAQASLGERGEITLSSDGYLDPGSRDFLGAFENALYEHVTLHATDLDLTVVDELAPGSLDGVAGRLTGDLEMNGPIQAPNLSGQVAIPNLALPEWPPLNVNGSAQYESGVLAARALIADEEGQLVETEGNLLLDLYELVIEPQVALASLETLPWRVSIRSPERQVASLPAPVQQALPASFGPLAVALSGTAAGGGLETHADVFVTGRWDEDLHDTLCGTSHRPAFTGNLSLADGRTTIVGTAFLGLEPLVRVRAEADTPVDDWLAAAVTPAMPTMDLRVEVPIGTASRIPGLCDEAVGDVAGVLEIEDWFGTQPRAEARFSAESLRFGDTEPLRGEGVFTANDGIATASGSFSWEDEEALGFAAEVGIDWLPGAAMPTTPPDAPVHADAEFTRAPLSPFLAWIDPVDSGAGHLTGHFSIRGIIDNPRGSGRVALEDGYLEIVGLGQHLDDVSGSFVLDGAALRVEDLTARDIDGLASANGFLRFDGLRPSRAEVMLESRAFPVRGEGAILATISGVAALEATVGPEHTDVDVDMRSLDVTLPDQSSRSAQPLEAHPDIEVVGAERAQASPSESHPVRFHVETARPFAVHRSDFSARVSADLTATYRDPDFIVDGKVLVEDGYYEVFGKRFEIQDGIMQFDGQAPLDPVVNFVVTHRVASTRNATVTVIVTNRLSDPRIDFRSDHPDCRQRAEVIAMLVTGRCGARGSTASDARAFDEQTNEFLGGLLAGVGTLFLREQFGGAGDFLPNLSVDQGLYGPRVRAGVNLDFLIPDFLRGAIQSIHADAALTTATESSDPDVFGGILEVIFDYGFVFRLRLDADATGSFGSDLNWEP